MQKKNVKICIIWLDFNKKMGKLFITLLPFFKIWCEYLCTLYFAGKFKVKIFHINLRTSTLPNLGQSIYVASLTLAVIISISIIIIIIITMPLSPAQHNQEQSLRVS